MFKSGSSVGGSFCGAVESLDTARMQNKCVGMMSVFC